MPKRRPPIPKKMREAAWKKNDGFCTWPECAEKGVILEHIIPFFFVQKHELENLEPRCRKHADEKTVLDQANIGHIRRVAGESGQYKRLKKRGYGLIKNRPTKWGSRKLQGRSSFGKRPK